MYENRSGRRIWPRHIVRWCAWLAVLAAPAWWYHTRERPITSRERLAILRDSGAGPSARRIAADNLQHAGNRIVPELIQELRDGDPMGRALAALALGRLESKAGDAVETLALAVKDVDSNVRLQACVALGHIGEENESAVAALGGGARDSDKSVRGAAFSALGRLNAAGSRELRSLITDSDADLRRRAVIELGRMRVDSDEVVKILHAALSDSDPRVRAESMAALSKQSALDLAQLAAAIKSDPDPLVRRTAIRLSAKQPSVTADILVPALNDVELNVRRAALAELDRMGPDAHVATSAVASLLDSADAQTAWSAANILGHIGPAARGAVERLLVCIGNPDFHVRSFGYHALRRIGPEGHLRPPELLAALDADCENIRSLVLWSPDPPPAPAAGPFRSGNMRDRPEGYGFTDADMQHVKKLARLVVLNLADNPVGNAGLSNLADLRELKHLCLRNTKITSAGLRHLVGLNDLETLDLAGCAIKDEGLSHLANLRSLRRLVLYGTEVTDAGLRQLKGLTDLEEVSFPEQVTLRGLAPLSGLATLDRVPKSVTDDDLSSIQSLTRLRELALPGRPITDAGLAWLRQLASLEKLDLRHTQVTDAGLVHLRSLVKLRSLWLDGTKVSKQGVKELQEVLPELAIPDAPGSTPPQKPNPEYEWGWGGSTAAEPWEYQVVGLKPI